MKNLISVMIMLLGFALMPVQFYMTYTLYSHVGAPERLWTLWIVSIPLGILLAILGEMAKKIK